jgi:uncharacterized protein YwqG
VTRDLVLDLIDHYGLSEFRNRLERCLKPSVRIRTARLAYDSSRLGSKFGDLPLLPETMAWPTWDAREWHEGQYRLWRERAARNPQGRGEWLEKLIARAEEGMHGGPVPLSFIGQVQLDEVPEPGLVGLPGNGRLLFFYDVLNSPGSYDPAARRSGQVVYVPDGAGVVRRAPEGLDGSAVFQTASMIFETEWTLPDDPRVEGIELNPWAEDEGGAAYAKLIGEIYGEGSVVHRMGGNAQPIQNDMRLEAQLVTNGIWCGDQRGYQDPRRAALEAGAADWQLLLQVDTDEDGPGWMWGDAGRLYFWIRQQDLRELDFERVWCSEQCH